MWRNLRLTIFVIANKVGLQVYRIYTRSNVIHQVQYVNVHSFEQNFDDDQLSLCTFTSFSFFKGCK